MHTDDAYDPQSAQIPQFSESFADVLKHLTSLSQRLYELLPDVTLSPDERLERLARIVPDSILASQQNKTGRAKLTTLRRRLAELVPDPALDDYGRLETLVRKVHELVPGDEPRLFKKLEAFGDKRRSDIGR